MNQILKSKFAVLLACLALVVSCSDDDNVGSTQSGRIQVSPSPVAFSQVDIGDSSELDVAVNNTASDTLRVFEVRLEPQDGGSTTGLELVDLPETPFEVEGNEARFFAVKYTPQEGQPPAAAKLVFVSSDARYTRDEPLEVEVVALANRPRLSVNPQVVRFPRQAPGARETRKVTLRNIGSAPLTIWSEPGYGGGEDFRLTAPSRTYPLELKIYDANLAEANPNDYELVLDVEYAPLGAGADSGEIQVISNDPRGESTANDEESITKIDVGANADAPCIIVDDVNRNLGQVPIGSATGDIVTITNCGSETLQVSSIRLTENSDDDEFELDLGGNDIDNSGDIDNPIQIIGGGEEQFLVKYTPVQEGLDRGTIIIASNDTFQPELPVNLTARGADGACPVADVGVSVRGSGSAPRPAITSNPLEYIVVDGSGSSDEDGTVVEYIWEFTQTPDGVSPLFQPTQQDPGDMDKSKREFRLLTAGTYEIELRVKDNEGFLGCEPAKATVTAIPNEKISVELTWTNPEDPDETDDTGSDVDLHLVKMGPGAWFETPYDVYFRNPNNSGAGSAIWSPESPSLDIDDRDGLGPENIQMDDPANCEWYAIGVHYYKQLFGTAYVTIRVYIDGNQVFEKINKPLARGGQFWDVARIHWSSGTVYDYDNIFEAAPSGQAPDVTPGMTASGLCTNAGLYPIQ